MATTKRYDVKDLALAPDGVQIEWADRQMPVLAAIRERFETEQPLAGYRVAACLHVTTETANLMRTSRQAAPTSSSAPPIRSTQDDVAAALVDEYGISTFAIKGEDNDSYYQHIEAAVDHKPHITMDDGADVIGVLHSAPRAARRRDRGHRGDDHRRDPAEGARADGKLGFPVVAVNEAKTKHLFDNRYGTGQSTVDGVIRATNVLLAGRTFVVAGYGWCGRGVAMRAKGMGAHVVVTEVDPMKAIEAVMDGFMVMPMEKAAEIGDIFITATGDKNVITKAHMEHARRRDHGQHGPFQRRDRAARAPRTRARRGRREFVESHARRRPPPLPDRGRPPRQPGRRRGPSGPGDGHVLREPGSSAEYVVANAASLEKKVYVVPEEIDNEIARLKLATMGVEIDQLTEEQAKYLASWDEGT